MQDEGFHGLECQDDRNVLDRRLNRKYKQLNPILELQEKRKSIQGSNNLENFVDKLNRETVKLFRILKIQNL